MSEQGDSIYEKSKQKEKQRSLERKILHALRDLKQPIKWDVLCANFGLESTGYMESVLTELKDARHVAVDKEQNVTITEIGLKRLAAGMY
jgi:hypothetical protein